MKAWVYITTNKPDGVLYTGVTSELRNRMISHKTKKYKRSKKQGRDWRLPTVIELLQAHNNSVRGFEKCFYWSSAKYSVTNVKGINFSDGGMYISHKIGAYLVRCVRTIK